jgi:hypothetical protein
MVVVVWEKGKVIDLRKVNTRSYPDAYPSPKQDPILSSLGGSTVFFSSGWISYLKI